MFTIADGSGGAFELWPDYRVPLPHPYCQHVNSTGTVATGWPVEGLKLDAVGTGSAPTSAIADGSGGVVAVWQQPDPKDSFKFYIYGQRLSGAGELYAGWREGGTPLANRRLGSGRLASLGPGLWVVGFDAFSQATGYDVFAQRVPWDDPIVQVEGSDGFASERPRVVPNPPLESARIEFRLATPAIVRCDIVDTHGRVVRRLSSDATMPAGANAMTFDGRDRHGAPVPPGLYFVRLIQDGRIQSVRLVWLR